MDDNLNMLIVKMCMKLGKVEDLTTRQKKVTGLMKVKTDWVVLRICSLQNFTRSYQSVDSFNDCLLSDKLLDMTKKENTESATRFPWCGMAMAKKTINMRDSDFNQSQVEAIQKSLIDSGVTVIKGGF